MHFSGAGRTSVTNTSSSTTTPAAPDNKPSEDNVSQQLTADSPAYVKVRRKSIIQEISRNYTGMVSDASIRWNQDLYNGKGWRDIVSRSRVVTITAMTWDHRVGGGT